jgi:proteasome accessory factor B
MPEKISKTQRWLDVITYLVGRRLPVTVDELMEQVPAYADRWRSGDERARESVRRTFERDKDELRKLGIPLETVTYEVHYGSETLEGYRLTRRDFYLPYLRLLREADSPRDEGNPPRSTDPARVAEIEVPGSEIQLAMDALWHVQGLPDFPLADDARSAARKVAFDLDAEELSELPVLYADRAEAEETASTLRLLSDALLDRKRVRFRYQGIHREEVTDRDVAPYGLFFRGDWYLVGHDALREAIRVFRVSRVLEAERNRKSPNTADYEIPGEFDLDAYLDREAWELGDDAEAALEAKVRFDFPRSLWAERNRYGARAAEHPDGSTVRTFQVRQVGPFLRWVLGMAGEAEVLGPSELRREFHALAESVLAVYGRKGGADG